METIYVCQKCGRAATPEPVVEKTWLIEWHKTIPFTLVIRCPNHITDWSLRNTVPGRTNALRQKAAAGRKMVLPPRNAYDPMPIHFQGAIR